MGVHHREDDRHGPAPADPAPGVLLVDTAPGPGGGLRCRCRGDVDLASAAILRTALSEALARLPKSLVVDLAEVGFFDSSGLNVLLRIRIDALAAGVPLALASPSASVGRVFELTGAGDIFTVQASA
jgi:anti-anti-sigma factor